jgi:ferredoxin
VTITPAECVNCRLCEEVCPFGAIDKPTTAWPKDQFKTDKIRLAALILLTPILMALLTWMGMSVDKTFSRAHPDVRLAERMWLEESGAAKPVTNSTGIVKITTNESDAFRKTGQTTATLYAHADAIRRQFRLGGGILGGFMGLVIGIKLIALSIRWRRDEYQAHRAGCLACGRCFEFCPVRIDSTIQPVRKQEV